MKLTQRVLTSLILGGAFGQAYADARIGPELTQMLPSLTGETRVIVTTAKRSDLDQVMQSLSVPYLAMQSLPMAGANLTKAQIESLSADARVASIYFDAPMEYYNYTSGEITGGHYVHDVEGVTGLGSTIAVLDSGVDGTHPDLEMGSKLVQNVKIVGDLDLAGGLNVFLEGVPNTDTSSGHGTHVAGTVAGSGAASANDHRRPYYHDGIAPQAKMVGIGAGDGVSILYALAGFDYAISNQDRYNIDIITNSWGGGDGANFDPYNPINQASYEAYRRGMVVTFAASNSGPDEDTLNRYAVAPWVINVAAGTADRGLANFSSRGVAGDQWKAPDVTAPGSGIISARGVNTALPLLGPVVEPDYPEYNLYYARMSGTSMATPFIAGVAALLLEVNPNLSPDQIETIIRDTADDMPGYQFHEVGDGYVNVAAAVAMARGVVGKRAEFLAGDTRWSSQGNWLQVAENDPQIDYISRWRQASSADSNDGQYLKSKHKNASLLFNVIGNSVLIEYLANPTGGRAEVFLNGQSVGMIDYFAEQATVKSFAVRDLAADQVHAVELRHRQGKINIDGLKIDGQLVDNGVQIITEQQMIEGTIGPSAENVQFNDHAIQVAANAVSIDAELSWEGVADLDFELIDPAGNVVASSASLDNPEVISFRPSVAGDYVLRVNGYLSVATNYQIDVSISLMQ